MKKKILCLFILLLLISVTGCSKSNNSEKSNNKEKSEKELLSSFLDDNTMWYNNTSVIEDSSIFKDAYYKIGSNNGNKYLFVKNDGSLFEYSNKKFSSTNSNFRLFNSKLRSGIIMGFANFDRMADNQKDGEYWFLLEDFSIVKFDSESDSIQDVNSFVNDGWGRENSTKHIIPSIKNSIKYNKIISWSDNMRSFITVNNNVLSIYECTGPTGDEEINVSETREIEEYDSIIIYSKDFIKINDDYYKYTQVNKEETDNYVDAKAKYAYEKISLNDLKDIILYWDGNLLITKSGNVYNTNMIN